MTVVLRNSLIENMGIGRDSKDTSIPRHFFLRFSYIIIVCECIMSMAECRERDQHGIEASVQNLWLLSVILPKTRINFADTQKGRVDKVEKDKERPSTGSP